MQALTRQLIELEKVSKKKNEFMAKAAHDLRNPLGIIAVHSRLLLESAAQVLQEEQLRALAQIHSSSRFLLRMVSDLLDFHRIESGEFSLDIADTDLLPIIHASLDLNRPLAERKSITVTLRHNGGLPSILADGPRLQQVLNNLLTNAIKFSHPHTAVLVEASQEQRKVLIAVKDQGQGIPPKELKRIFEPLAQISVRSTAGEEGVGLGLAFCQEIMARHGGSIWAESEAGKGSSFYLLLRIRTSSAGMT